MKRLPLLPTLLVAAAVAAMVCLGFWQLHRARWKEALLVRYEANSRLPPVTIPDVPTPRDEQLLFRRATSYCLKPQSWSARSGRNRAGDVGWRHIALCGSGAEGPGIAVDLGWSNNSDNPKGYTGGPVSGVIGAAGDRIILLVSDRPAPGLQPSALPSLDDIPNNHRAYAVQWFLFAGVATLIYALALRRRNRPRDEQ